MSVIFTGTPFRRLVGLVLVLLLVCAAAAAWLGWRGLQARDHLTAARASLEDARAALVGRDVPAGRAAVEAAGADTREARLLTRDPVWRLGAALPLLGNSLQTARGLAVAADDLARGVLPAAVAAAQSVDPQALRRQDGSVDLDLLRQVSPDVVVAAERADAVAGRTAELPTRAVLGPVARAHADLTRQVNELAGTLTAASEGVQIAPTLLGVDRARRYLVLVQQTAESRGTGGLLGGYAAIEAEDGRIRVLSSGSNAELKAGRVPPPAGVPQDFRDRYEARATFALWQNVNMSPDLPVVARVVASRWRAQGGGELDGVIALDARALSSLLAGSPPLQLPGGESLAAEAVEEFLAVGQYRGLGIGDERVARKERLSEVADVALARLAGGGGDSVALLEGLVDAVRSGHLRMASDDPELAPVLERTGVDGGLPEGDRPLAYPVVHNTIGGKLDHWLDRTVRYEAGDCGSDRRASTITTTLRSTPPEGLPPYNTIRIDDVTGEVVQSRTGQVLLNVYATPGAVLVRATLDGEPVSTVPNRTPLLLEKGTEAGLPVWSVRVDLPPGEARVFVLELVEPTTAGAALVPEQPLSRDLVRAVDVPVC